ncbi:periplasmic chaperone for outer membrane proteins Skp [Mucilaginibacter oryzae]|uniref:Periplasmic chaperone for outer membrane proteins Skp n=1 Tax=Mucilaginibacter oryzae TaxID=468058 RepID=A0A316HGB7_9SPHI|nr:OmpH family outer membrane protein [Mucilaginibacter oryzae]PWK80269.1 periplasmic chaperone for outer membrane proteins Skp [Mucilaginibacter oryzae]
MKKLFKVALVAVGMLFVGSFANAQSKIGHINFNQLIDLMPETKTVSTSLQAYQKTFIDQMTTMNNEYQAKVKEYTDKRTTMTDAVRTAKENELTDMQKRMNDYQNNAQQQVDAKRQELGKPIIDKATAAVQAIAKEKGYAYVLDSSQITLLVAPDADDLMAAAKLKLGLK